MKQYRLADSGDRGWFIGDFDKAVWRLKDFEIGYHLNYKGEISESHVHKIAVELSLITSGKVEVNGIVFGPGDMFEIAPGEILRAVYLEDTNTVCIKMPSIPTDKYFV